MERQKHIIKRQVLDITISEKKNASRIQNRVSDIVHQKMNPALDRKFSKITNNHTSVRIDKLIIDLGTISETELEEALIIKAVAAADDKIRRLINADKTAISPLSINGNGSTKYPAPHVNVVSKPVDAMEKFVFFLKTGHFPWWQKEKSQDGLDEIFSQIIILDVKNLQDRLFPVLRESKITQRLVFQFDPGQLDNLLNKLDGKFFQVSKELIKGFTGVKGNRGFKKGLKGSFHQITFRFISNNGSLENESNKSGFVKEVIDKVMFPFSSQQKQKILGGLIQHLIPELKTAFVLISVILKGVLYVILDLPSLNPGLFKIVQSIPVEKNYELSEIISQISQKLSIGESKQMKPGKETGDLLLKSKDTEKEPDIAGKTEKQDTEEAQQEGKNRSGFKENQKSKVEGLESSEKFQSRSTFRNMEGLDEIYIYNAGLVLLHPFLFYFFDGLNLLDSESRFKSLNHAHKAIHLLQYMVTGKEETAEYDLSLNKIICGLELTEPVPKTVQLTDEEKEECTNLMVTVLQRWEALKTENPEALQQTYLSREGILKQEGPGWNLMVERNTFDVMLEKLPWGISIIKFPWNPQIIYVEW